MLPKFNAMMRLTREPEFIVSQNGTQICKVGLVASEKYKDKETTLFLDGVAFGKTAEFLNSVQKGQRVYITAKLHTESWQDQNNQKRSKISATIDSFEYVEKRDGQGQQQSYQPNNNQQAQQTGENAPTYHEQMPKNNIPAIDIDEDEIPF